MIRSTARHTVPLGLALVAFSVPIASHAGRTLEPLISPTDDRCTDYAQGALSHDGQHLLITQNCHPVSSEGAEDRGTLWRDFRSTSGLASRVWTPGHFFDLSADGRWLAYADGPAVYLIDLATGAVARAFRGHSAAVTGLAFAPDSARLFSASLDTTVLAWDVGPPPS